MIKGKAGLVAPEDRLDLVGEGLEGAAEIGRGHAQGLGNCLRFDSLSNRHGPFYRRHTLGHGVDRDS